MDALLSMPWILETIAEGQATEQIPAIAANTNMDKALEQEAMQTGIHF